MNVKKAVLVLALFALIVGAGSTGAYFISNSPSTYKSFTLTASGTANDSVKGTVPVSLSIVGTTSGNWKSQFSLNVKGTSATVDGYTTFAVSGGSGYVKQKSGDFKLNLQVMSNVYGGKSVTWNFGGMTTSVVGNVVTVSITATSETLPTTGTPAITNMVLTGTVTFQ